MTRYAVCALVLAAFIVTMAPGAAFRGPGRSESRQRDHDSRRRRRPRHGGSRARIR